MPGWLIDPSNKRIKQEIKINILHIFYKTCLNAFKWPKIKQKLKDSINIRTRTKLLKLKHCKQK